MLRDIKRYLVLVILVLMLSLISVKGYSTESSNIVIPEHEFADIQNDRLTKDTAKDYTHEVIGSLIIPGADIDIPIMQAQSSGTDNYAMQTTVAHDSTTGLPGDGEPIVIAGHREKEFYKLYDIEEGMIAAVIIGDNISYYQVTTMGFFEDDAIETVFGGDEEELRLYTCYPRAEGSYITGRYGIKASPIDQEEVPISVIRAAESKIQEQE